MKSTLKSIFQPIARDLKEFDRHFTEIMTSEIKLVDKVASYIVKHKGKQFRPALLIAAARAAGEPGPHTYTTAAVVELLHTATLMHDDVLDEAELRRGIATIHKVWKNKIAILMGDYLLARALIASTETGSLEVMNTVATVAKRLIQGQIFEIQKARGLDINEEDYFKMIGDKTASLICACCDLGALSVKASPEHRQALSQFGELLGIAFQIKDDLLDYESSSAILGKPAMSDLQDKKITLPLLYALKEASDKEKKAVIKRIKNGKNQKDTREVYDFVIARNGVEKARMKAEQVKQEAIDALSVLPASPARTSLEDLAEFVIQRKK